MPLLSHPHSPAQRLKGHAWHSPTNIECWVPQEQRHGPEQMYMVQNGLQVSVQAMAEEQPGVIQHLAGYTIGGSNPRRKEDQRCPWILGTLDAFSLSSRGFPLFLVDYTQPGTLKVVAGASCPHSCFFARPSSWYSSSSNLAGFLNTAGLRVPWLPPLHPETW